MRFVGDLRHLLRGVRFRQLFAVRVTSQCADGMFQVGLASYVLFSPERQADAPAIAATLAAILLPFSLIGPVAGVLLDRWSRRQILVVANLVRILPVVAVATVVGADGSEAVLFPLVLAALSVNRFLLAGLSAALPHVVDRDDLVLANAVTPTSGTIAFMVGLGVASGLRPVIPGSDPDVVIVLAAALGYGAAGVLATRLPPSLLGPEFDPHRPQVRQAVRHVASGFVDGLRHLRHRPVAAAALAVIAGHRFFYGLSAVSTILLYRNYFHDPDDTDAALAGLALAVLASGVGFFLAAVLTPLAIGYVTPQRWMVLLLALAAVVEVVPGGLYTEAAVVAAAFGLGLSAQGVKICVDTLVQTHVDDAYRGRVFSIYDVIFNVVFVAAAAVGAVLIPTTGKSYGVLALVAAGYAATALAYGRAESVSSDFTAHQASNSARARSSPSGPSSIRRSSRNL